MWPNFILQGLMVANNAKLILELPVCPDLLRAGLVTKADQLKIILRPWHGLSCHWKSNSSSWNSILGQSYLTDIMAASHSHSITSSSCQQSSFHYSPYFLLLTIHFRHSILICPMVIYENTFAPLKHNTLDMEGFLTRANLIPNTADTNTLYVICLALLVTGF